MIYVISDEVDELYKDAQTFFDKYKDKFTCEITKNGMMVNILIDTTLKEEKVHQVINTQLYKIKSMIYSVKADILLTSEMCEYRSDNDYNISKIREFINNIGDNLMKIYEILDNLILLFNEPSNCGGTVLDLPKWYKDIYKGHKSFRYISEYYCNSVKQIQKELSESLNSDNGDFNIITNIKNDSISNKLSKLNNALNTLDNVIIIEE